MESYEPSRKRRKIVDSSREEEEEDEEIEMNSSSPSQPRVDPINLLNLDFQNYDGNISKEETEQYFDDIYNAWFHGTDPIKNAFRNFGVAEEQTPTLEKVQKTYNKIVRDALFISHWLAKYGILKDPEKNKKNNKILHQIYYSFNILTSSCHLKLNLDATYDSQETDEIDLFRFRTINIDGTQPFQRLLLWILFKIKDLTVKRKGDTVYRKLMIDDGKTFTYAWESWFTIKEFIHHVCDKDTNFEHWKDMTSSPQNISRAEEYLKDCSSMDFPLLQRERSCWSFRNGVYIARYRTIENKFYSYSSDSLPHGIATAKYFDSDFTAEWTTMPIKDIPTPTITKILDYQGMDEEVQKWFYILSGRLCFAVGELDKWQVVFFIKGLALTGKSSFITNLFRQFYDVSDIGVLANNIEPIFGLSQFYDKFMYVAPEIKRDLRLDQANFQQMASGESIVIVIKGKTAFTIPKWTSTGIWAGNEAPSTYSDNSGSISRRFIVFRFEKKVKDEDTSLPGLLSQQVPASIVKSCRYYLDIVKTSGTKGIWNILPHYFMESKEQLQIATNPLIAFLKDKSAITIINKEEDPVGWENTYIQETCLKKHFTSWCDESGYGGKDRPRWNSDLYSDPMSKYGIEVKPGLKKKYPRNGMGSYHHGTFYFGCDLTTNIIEKNTEPLEPQTPTPNANPPSSSILSFVSTNT